MIILFVLLGLAMTAFEGWVVMLVWGALHSQAPWVPTLSYSASLWVAMLVSFLVGSAVVKANAA